MSKQSSIKAFLDFWRLYLIINKSFKFLWFLKNSKIWDVTNLPPLKETFVGSLDSFLQAGVHMVICEILLGQLCNQLFESCFVIFIP